MLQAPGQHSRRAAATAAAAVAAPAAPSAAPSARPSPPRRRPRPALLPTVAAAAVSPTAAAATGSATPKPPTPVPAPTGATGLPEGTAATSQAVGVQPPPNNKGKLSLKKINVAFIPADDAGKTLSDNKDLLAYMKQSFGVDVSGAVGTSYTAVIEAMRSKKVDIGFYGPFSSSWPTRRRTRRRSSRAGSCQPAASELRAKALGSSQDC